MVFTTQIFVFIFMPICISLYFILRGLEKIPNIGIVLSRFRFPDLLIVFASLAFYMWACFDNVILLVLYILLVYILARFVEQYAAKKYIDVLYKDEKNDRVLYKKFIFKEFPFVLLCILLVGILIYYKYSNFLIQTWNMVFGASLISKNLIAPLGISFITFSAISYVTDIYRGNAKSGSLLDCALYLSFFPKVTSGPIVLWKNFQKQIYNRKESLELFVNGINRIMIGFSKKLILADVFGECLSGIGLDHIDRVTAFLTLVIYMLQIYYDFSGYSDIAIGLSNIFGYEFKENFNFPYRSKSISEFWRRWHISLGNWFREYVYFPLGGSRVELGKILRNLAIVFALTGIWHGAGYNYILWGLINGGLVILERLIGDSKVYKKIPNCIKYVCTMSIVLMFWQFFRFQTLDEIGYLFGIILGIVKFDSIYYTWQYLFDARIVVFIAVGVFGATVLGSPKVKVIYEKLVVTKLGYFVQEVILLCLFVIAIMFMINSTYSPFIYFQY